LKQHWQVSQEESGSSLVAFIKLKLGNVHSLNQIKSAVERGACELNGRVERFASTRLGTGDVIGFSDEALSAVIKKMDFEPDRILYADPLFIAYNKPAGISFEILLGHLKALYDVSLTAVHRLDRETSGVILFARGEENAQMIEDLFRKRAIQKTYLAIVDGVILQDSGTIRNFLGKKKKYQGQAIWGEVDRSQGLLAETSWECLKRGKDSCLLQCMPKTGRTHQIRVHLSSLGHPILGDYQYGKVFRCSFKPLRQMLHAFQLSFFLVSSGKSILIEAPLPQDFIDAKARLKS
jgi:RluA family pseudouridine synthase